MTRKKGFIIHSPPYTVVTSAPECEATLTATVILNKILSKSLFLDHAL
jgi:hypothetical protein